VEAVTVDPAETALIIVDPQHDFCSENGAMAQRFGFDMADIRAAVPRLNDLIGRCRAAGIRVVWIREIFADSKMLPSHKELWGSGDDIWLIREDGHGIDWYAGMITPLPAESVITKYCYDGFADTDLDLLLRSNGVNTLLMTGFTSNVCVETTARSGYVKGYGIVFVADCAGAPTPAEHESAIHNISTYFGKTTTSEHLSLSGRIAGSDVKALALRAEDA